MFLQAKSGKHRKGTIRQSTRHKKGARKGFKFKVVGDDDDSENDGDDLVVGRLCPAVLLFHFGTRFIRIFFIACEWAKQLISCFDWVCNASHWSKNFEE